MTDDFHGGTVNVIYTFKNKEQEMTDLPFVPSVLKSENCFKDFITAILSKKDFQDLAKISTCINFNNRYDATCIPNWYNNCNGKFFF